MNNSAVPQQRIKLYVQFIKHFWRNYAKTRACKLVIRKLLNSASTEKVAVGVYLFNGIWFQN
jgi:sulfur relay (sulfurtransferase) DsrC/TusE family protein